MKLIGVFLALIAGNFIYQLMTALDWSTAIERSWFQGAALLLAWLFVWRKA